jgi:hypothetical protein
MNKRQRIKHRRLGITKLVMKLLKEIDEIQESKSERRIRPLMHKRWVHKRFYVRRRTRVEEREMIHYCFCWLTQGIGSKETALSSLKCISKSLSPKEERKLLRKTLW